MNGIISGANRVAFQGERGAFGNQAAREALPHCEAVPKSTFGETVAALQDGETDLAIIPVENSLHGRISDVYHILPDAGLHIVGEYFLPIHLQLLGVEGATVEDLKIVVSQSPALGQCRKLIKDRGLKTQDWFDTAGSARYVSELGDPSVAAVASSLAGEIYGLSVLQANVEDEAHNATRFLIMARSPNETVDGQAPVVTTLVFRVRNVPAALFKALGGFATNGVNMTKLESYQMGGTFNATQFYADIDGHPDENPVRLALEELSFFSNRVTVLGSYAADSFRKRIVDGC